MPTPPPWSASPKPGRAVRVCQPRTRSAAPPSAALASRSSMGKSSRSTAYFKRKATPKNNTTTPTVTMRLGPVKYGFAQLHARSKMSGSRSTGAAKAGGGGGVARGGGADGGGVSRTGPAAGGGGDGGNAGAFGEKSSSER